MSYDTFNLYSVQPLRQAHPRIPLRTKTTLHRLRAELAIYQDTMELFVYLTSLQCCQATQLIIIKSCVVKDPTASSIYCMLKSLDVGPGKVGQGPLEEPT